ncbi:MAG TPA: 2-oxoglutarate and iron-dependent oxygenase domain-containing protein [Casimicrobium sp.]|nr:2-oxoglutarate and iron-dependent oxygenase domain-containing protein [Casimicrobium sp.]
MTPDIPTIDISQFDVRDSASLAKLGQALGDCARGLGFFVLTNHAVPAALRERVFAQSAQLFATDATAKAKLSIQRAGNNRGYVALGEERLNSAMPGDVKEAFNIGWDLPADHPDVVACKPFRGANVWPDAQALPQFRATMLEYFNACHQLGLQLHRALAQELGVAENFFDDKLDQPLATLRLLHYPPRPERFEEGQIGAGEHTDYGNLTLLVTDDAGGLEVRTRAGEWLAVPNIPGAIICNIGDCLMRWTNDVFISTPHRVVNPIGRERFSVAFFLDPNPDAVVACLPTCASAERPAKYAPTTGAAYLKERLDATYGVPK